MEAEKTELYFWLSFTNPSSIHHLMLRGFKELVGPAPESHRRESVSHHLSHSKYKTVEIYNTFEKKRGCYSRGSLCLLIYDLVDCQEVDYLFCGSKIAAPFLHNSVFDGVM